MDPGEPLSTQAIHAVRGIDAGTRTAADDRPWVAAGIAQAHEQAREFLAAGRVELAAGVYQVFLTNASPSLHYQAFLHLGALMRDQGRWAEAQAYLRHCVRLRPQCMGGHCELGCVIEEAGDEQGALDVWQQALMLTHPADEGSAFEVERIARHIARAHCRRIELQATALAPSPTSLAAPPKSTARPVRSRPFRLLIRGWRGINHSYALVNQYQIVELVRNKDVQLFHEDLPFISGNWSKQENGAGFDEEATRLINGLPAHDGGPLDATYTISAPLELCNLPAARHATFAVTEFGLNADNFAPGATDPGAFTRDSHMVVTPSRWARDKLVQAGMSAQGIHVIPHGVDPRIFFPQELEQRSASRRTIGLGDEHFAFLNIGGTFWNKGIDLLVLAFAQVLRDHPGARLLLKDNRKLYGITSDDTIGKLMQRHPELVTQQVLAAITTIPGTLTLSQLASLYNAVDLYVSPYRAEGFNMPVLESMGCGLPVLVTAGGASDDFVTPEAGEFIPSRLIPVEQAEYPVGGAYMEPDLEGLTEHMLAAVSKGRAAERPSKVGPELHWRGISDRLLALLSQ